jgi:hypothetical protein
VGALDDAVDREVAKGARLKSRTDEHAVVGYGAGNVLMHITFAARWANTIRERRGTVEVDRHDEVIRHR